MSDPQIISDTVNIAVPNVGGLQSNCPILEFDLEKYRGHIRALNLSGDQENQLMIAMWDVMMAFVDIGFGLHPVQHAVDVQTRDKTGCGELTETRRSPALDLRDVIASIIAQSDDLAEQFNDGAASAGG